MVLRGEGCRMGLKEARVREVHTALEPAILCSKVCGEIS